MSSINNMISSAVDLAESSYGSYISTWKESPVKMTLGHLTVGASIAGAIYFREDIGQLARHGIQNVKFAMDVATSKMVTYSRNIADAATAKVSLIKDAGLSAINTAKNVAKASLNTLHSKTVSGVNSVTNFATTNFNSLKSVAFEKASHAATVSKNFAEPIVKKADESLVKAGQFAKGLISK